jgi:hypothetical protein
MRGVKPLNESILQAFEEKFDFHFTTKMRQFLLLNNGGVSSGAFYTVAMQRTFSSLLDFEDKTSPSGAWAINRRLRKQIGEKRIIIGMDSQKNYICVERNRREQKIVVWSHVTNMFDSCLHDIPSFLSFL